MWGPYLYPILLPALIVTSEGVQDRDVFVVTSGHAEAEVRKEEEKITERTTTEDVSNITLTTMMQPTEQSTTEEYENVTDDYESATEDTVFVPNERPEASDTDGEPIQGIIKLKGGLMGEGVELTEAPEVYFITGKNDENVDKEEKKEQSRRKMDVEKVEHKTVKPKLNCTHLDCTNTIQTICGAKYENKQWKYRLFLNDCYFRKVNCQFRHEYNRYNPVPEEYCQNSIAAKYMEHAFSFTPKSPYVSRRLNAKKTNMESSISRRSMTLNANGKFCSHACPVTCTEDYDPQCAVSNTGHRKVFMNHCKMDYNSCFYNVVWNKRPLAECVGGKKADMRHNRRFIGWMQRVGIVDNKGRLNLE